MKQLKLRKLNIGDADILSRLELKNITGGDYDDTSTGLTCVRYCYCAPDNRKVACDCSISGWDCFMWKCGGNGICPF